MLPVAKNQRGFTLIELLVVIMVIGALSGVVVSMVSSGGFRDKAKDSQRASNLKQIQTALELYFADYRAYPTTGGSWALVSGSGTLATALEPAYINSIPTDPDGTGSESSPCSNPEGRRYNYYSPAGGGSYLLAAIMALPSSNDGHECSSLNGWAGCGGSFATSDYCYGVENP